MDADYTAWASAVAAFSAVVCWTDHLFIVIMANAYRNADFSLAIFRPLRTGRRFTAKIGNLFLVLHKCNIRIYFLLLLTQVDLFGTTFYFLESRKFSHYFYFLKSRIFGMYFYFLESSKVIYFWQHWMCPSQPTMGSGGASWAPQRGPGRSSGRHFCIFEDHRTLLVERTVLLYWIMYKAQSPNKATFSC